MTWGCHFLTVKKFFILQSPIFGSDKYKIHIDIAFSISVYTPKISITAKTELK